MTTTQMSRRAFTGLAGGALATLGLAACSAGGGAGGSKDPLKFWNMQWGATSFAPLDRKITESYSPKGGLPRAVYQSVAWQAFTQTFSTAIAAHNGPAVSSGSGTARTQNSSRASAPGSTGLSATCARRTQQHGQPCLMTKRSACTPEILKQVGDVKNVPCGQRPHPNKCGYAPGYASMPES